MKRTATATKPSENIVRDMRIGYLVGSVAWQIVVPFGVALFAGLWLDGQLGSGRVATVALVLASLPISAYLVMKTVRTIFNGLPEDPQ